MDWCLYDRDLCHERINHKATITCQTSFIIAFMTTITIIARVKIALPVEVVATQAQIVTEEQKHVSFYHNGIKTGNNNVHFIGGKIRQQWIISMIIKLCWWLKLREWQDYFPLQPNFITSWSKLFVTKCSSFQISNSGKVLLQVTPSFHDNRVVQLTYSNGITSITTWVRE